MRKMLYVFHPEICITHTEKYGVLSSIGCSHSIRRGFKKVRCIVKDLSANDSNGNCQNTNGPDFVTVSHMFGC